MSIRNESVQALGVSGVVEGERARPSGGVWTEGQGIGPCFSRLQVGRSTELNHPRLKKQGCCQGQSAQGGIG